MRLTDRRIHPIIRRDNRINTKWIIEGQPAKGILKLTEEQYVNLIVMGTLGKSGIEKFLLGSVADKVIRGSRIPVLTVRK